MSTTTRVLKRFTRYRLSTLLLAMVIFAVWLSVKFYREPMTPQNLSEIRQLTKLDQDIWEVAWSPDRKRLALLGWETSVDIRQTATLLPLATIGKGKKIIHFAFSVDANVVAYCENGTVVELVDLRAGKSLRLNTENDQPGMKFSPDGSLLATGGYGNSVRLWNVADGVLVRVIDTGPTTGGLTVVFSPDGKTLAVGNRNGSTRLFEVHTGALLHELPKGMSHGLAFDPSGKTLAVAYADGGVALWDVASGALQCQRDTAAEEIYRVDWSPDGKLLASCGLGTDITIWSSKDLTELQRLAAGEWVIGLKFSPDGARLITAGGTQQRGGKREVQVWGVSPLAKRIVGR